MLTFGFILAALTLPAILVPTATRKRGVSL